MARSSMAALILRVRKLINDVDAGIFDDDEVQECLDDRQTVWIYEPMRETPHIAPDRTLSYLRFFTDVGNWETDEELINASYTVLTPATSDEQNAVWTFPATPLRPLRISGKTYDLNGAAADLCRRWASKLKLRFDFKSKDQDLARSQQIKMVLDMADEFDRKSAPVTIRQVRADVASS